MSETIKLKPCPFCGSANIEIEPLNKYRTSLFCGECHAGFRGENKDILIEKWNKRQ